jgi:TonB family protein
VEKLEKRRPNMKLRLVAVFILACGLTLSTVAWGGSGATGQIIVDRNTRNKTLNDYTLLTRDCIQRAWTTPVDMAMPGALKGKVSINYTVRRSGAVERVELIRGSGVPEMDRTLLKAIRAAAPFPPFPDGVEANSIMIRANFVVADLPTLPVTTVAHEVDADKTSAESAPDHPNKPIWGAPAGSSIVKEDEAKNATPPAPTPKRYKWGMDR